GRRRGLLEGVDEHLGPPSHVLTALAVEIRDRDEHLLERRQAVPRLGRVVRPAEERLAGRRQEDGQRPAAVTGHRGHRVHVDPVQVRALLTVDLDADEALVHQRRGDVVLEGLVLHDVTPVAGRVADREQDRLVLFTRARERLLAPGVPVDRVVSVLEQVRARLARQAIHACTVTAWHFPAGPSPFFSPTSRARRGFCRSSATTTARSWPTTGGSSAASFT